MNFPDGMTSRDWDHVEGVGMLEEFPTRVLRVVVYLTYAPHGATCEEEMIDEVMPPYEAEKMIARTLTGGRGGIEYTFDDIDVVDAEYMSPEEADNYGVPPDVLAAAREQDRLEGR